jgi:hypothetical protein
MLLSTVNHYQQTDVWIRHLSLTVTLQNLKSDLFSILFHKLQPNETLHSSVSELFFTTYASQIYIVTTRGRHYETVMAKVHDMRYQATASSDEKTFTKIL